MILYRIVILRQCYPADEVDEAPVKDVKPSTVEAELRKPSFTKQPTTVLTVKQYETATLLANIDGAPRPNG